MIYHHNDDLLTTAQGHQVLMTFTKETQIVACHPSMLTKQKKCDLAGLSRQSKINMQEDIGSDKAPVLE